MTTDFELFRTEKVNVLSNCYLYGKTISRYVCIYIYIINRKIKLILLFNVDTSSTILTFSE